MKIDNRNNRYGTADASRAGGHPSGPVRGYGMRGGEDQVPAAAQGQPAQQPYGYQQTTHTIPMQGAHAAQVPYGAGAPAQVVYVQQPPKKRKRVGLIVAIILAIICIALAAVLAFSLIGPPKSARQGDTGQLDGKSPEEIQAEIDRVVEEGMFNISIASTVQFPDGTSPGELRIENVPGNHYLMRVEIVRDDTGELIYTTDYIEPDHHIQTDTLNVDLPAGSYPSTATFFAYDEETEDLVGQAAAKVTIEVLG